MILNILAVAMLLVAIQLHVDTPFRCNLEASMRAMRTYYYRDLAYSHSAWPYPSNPLAIISDCDGGNIPLVWGRHPFIVMLGSRAFFLTCVVEGESCIPTMISSSFYIFFGAIIDTVIFAAAMVWMAWVVFLFAISLCLQALFFSFVLV